MSSETQGISPRVVWSLGQSIQ